MCKVFRNGVDISNNLWLLGVSVFIVQYGSMRFFFYLVTCTRNCCTKRNKRLHLQLEFYKFHVIWICMCDNCCFITIDIVDYETIMNSFVHNQVLSSQASQLAMKMFTFEIEVRGACQYTSGDTKNWLCRIRQIFVWTPQPVNYARCTVTSSSLLYQMVPYSTLRQEHKENKAIDQLFFFQ